MYTSNTVHVQKRDIQAAGWGAAGWGTLSVCLSVCLFNIFQTLLFFTVGCQWAVQSAESPIGLHQSLRMGKFSFICMYTWAILDGVLIILVYLWISEINLYI